MKLDDLCIKLLLYTLCLESDTNTHTHLPQDILYKEQEVFIKHLMFT